MRSLTRTAVILFLVFIYTWGLNWYEPEVDLLVCTGPGCWHEIGHKMDADLGYPSRTPQFGLAIQQYVLVEMRSQTPSKLAEALFTYPYRYDEIHPYPTYELYAIIYDYVQGDLSKMPEIFRPFYSDSEMYSILHRCLMEEGVNPCGRSFSWVEFPSMGVPSLLSWRPQ